MHRLILLAALACIGQAALGADENQYCGGPRRPASPSDLANVVGELTIQAQVERGEHMLRCGYGYAAAKCGDHATAVRIFESCVERGHAGAMIWLGALYENGNGVERSLERAAELYRRAALSGHRGYATLGKLHWGTALYAGAGVPRDREEGLKWMRRAADDGDRDAIEFLAAHGETYPARK